MKVVERSAPLTGDFRAIVGPTPVQMDDFCDLHGTPDTQVSRIATVKKIYKLIRNFLPPQWDAVAVS